MTKLTHRKKEKSYYKNEGKPTPKDFYSKKEIEQLKQTAINLVYNIYNKNSYIVNAIGFESLVNDLLLSAYTNWWRYDASKIKTKSLKISPKVSFIATWMRHELYIKCGFHKGIISQQNYFERLIYPSIGEGYYEDGEEEEW